MKMKPKKFRCTPRSAIFLASINSATGIVTTRKHSFSANRRSYVEDRASKNAGDLRAAANDLKNIVRTQSKGSLAWRAKAENGVVWTWNNDLDALHADLNATHEKREIAKVAKQVPQKPDQDKPVRSNSI